MCLAVFTINVDTTIVNVTLPTLVSELGATTRDLLWIVDSYLLVFAALVLAGGSLSDRFGRRAVLLLGLAVFGLGNTLASFASTPAELIAARAFTGIGAAAVFPTTLSILTQVYRERAARAKAIGLWGASTGLAVAFGPITGGALLERFWWGSTFLVKLPIALVAIALVLLLVPESRDPEAPRIDVPGIVLSALGLAALVYTIIEAPGHGWTSVLTLSGFALSAGAFAAFVRHERRTPQPMLDLRLFADRRFTAAALAITVAFFALFGFIFLIVQYFQFLRGYSPLETGVRILPVALCVAAGSIAGTLLVVRLGNKAVVTAGLLSLSVAYAWVSTASGATSYREIAGQMVFLGLGMGLTSAPATESIMSAVQTDKAGIGSAVNDATREVGGGAGGRRHRQRVRVPIRLEGRGAEDLGLCRGRRDSGAVRRRRVHSRRATTRRPCSRGACRRRTGVLRRLGRGVPGRVRRRAGRSDRRGTRSARPPAVRARAQPARARRQG